MRVLLSVLALTWLAPVPCAWAAAASAAAPRDSTLTLPGLMAPARVVTDRWGIPHLEAASLADLYLSWGFVTARDRMWQLEISRRAARGELSEWFGNRALRDDGGAQLFELKARAQRIWMRDRSHPETREPLERYAAGINAWLAACRRGAAPWPPELRRLRRQPEDWRPEDTVLLLLAQGLVLDLTLPELDEEAQLRERGRTWVEARRRFESQWMYATIPDSAAERIWGRAPRRALPGRPFPAGTRSGGRMPPPPSGSDAARLADAADRPLRRAAEQVLGGWLATGTEAPERRASDAFAVGPERSASGAAILANDPHLDLTAPGPLELVHVSVPGEVDAIGACLPGLPLIVSGRNRQGAWGVAALSADVIDVYADTLSANGRQVRWNGRWVPIREADYTMRYRVLSLIPLPVAMLGQKRRYTPHGPVLVHDRKRGLAYAARWAGRDEAITLGRLLGLERSRSAVEVAARFRTLVTPTLNVIAADLGGHVVYQAVGAVPRRGFDPGLGVLPGDGQHEWQGLIAPEEMPAWQAPRRGFVVNGNNLPVGSPYPEALPRYDWPHDRALRMAERLAGDPSVTLEDAASIQNDVVSGAARRIVPLLLRCAASVATRLTPRERAALDTLRGWDFAARRGRVAPTLYRAWFGALLRRSRLERHGLAIAALEGRAPEALRAPDANGDRRAPREPERLERPGQAAVAALELALDQLTKQLGPDLERWTWARAHRASFAHALSWLDSTFALPTVPADGDNSTPCVGPSRLPWNLTFVHGPVIRHLVDLAVPDSSLGVVAPGNGAQDPHRSDHLARWANHGYVPLYLAWDRIAAAKESEWRLVPAATPAGTP